MADPDESTRPPPADGPDEQAAIREPVFNLPFVVIALIAACVAVQAVRAFLLTPDQDFALLVRAAFVPIRYSGEFPIDIYAFTTPVTYSLLHGGWTHLGVNMIWLAAFGSPLAARIGAPRFLLFWIAASVAAVALFQLLNSGGNVPLVGASGAISGMMGAAARFGFRIERTRSGSAFGGPVLPIALVLRNRGVFTFLAVWMAVNLVTGLLPGFAGEDSVAWEAHIGGFLVGFFAMPLFDRPGGRDARLAA